MTDRTLTPRFACGAKPHIGAPREPTHPNCRNEWGACPTFPGEEKVGHVIGYLDRSVISPLDEVLILNNLEMVGIGLDQRVCKLVPDRGSVVGVNLFHH